MFQERSVSLSLARDAAISKALTVAATELLSLDVARGTTEVENEHSLLGCPRCEAFQKRERGRKKKSKKNSESSRFTFWSAL